MVERFRESLVEMISPAAVWAILLVTVLVFTVVSIALMYHWKNYNVDSGVAKRIGKVYFLVSGAFLLAMLLAAIAYST